MSEPRFPVLKVTGGPHAHNMKSTLNGQPMEKVYRMELVFDVNDVVRVKTYQFALADVEIEIHPEGPVEAAGYVAQIVERRYTRLEELDTRILDPNSPKYEGRGSTAKAAMQAAVDQMPEDPS